jgi:hypothetical protein
MDEQIMTDTWWMRMFRVAMYGSTLMVLTLGCLFVFFDFSDHPYDYGYGYRYTLSFEPNYQSIGGEEELCSYRPGAVVPKDGSWVRLENSRLDRPSNWVDFETSRRLTVQESLELELQKNQGVGLIKCGDIQSVNELVRYYAHVMADGDSFPESVPLIFVKQADGTWVRHNSSEGRRYTKEEVDRLYRKIDGLKQDFENGRIQARKTVSIEMWLIVKTIAKTVGIVAIWYLFVLILYRATLFIVYGHTKIARRAPR